MYSELTRSIYNEPSGYEVSDCDWFVRTKRGTIIAEMVGGVIQGTAFLALTGPPGSGKTTLAAAIRDELVSRSVRVLSVSRGEGDSIRLRDIVSQLLGEPEAALNEDDIDRLFDVMTMPEAAESRFVLMIDDAEVLRPGALEYLNLLSSVAMAGAPQVVFIGRPEFWDAADHTAPSQFKELITARWQLGRLGSDEAREFFEQLIASRGLATQDVFNNDGIDALIERSGGLCGRIVSILSLARAMQEERHEYWLTSSVIDEAAAKLDAGGTASLDHDGRMPHTEAAHTAIEEPMFAPETLPVPDVDKAPVGDPAVANRSLGWRRYACRIGLVTALFAAGTVPYWQGSAYSHRAGKPVSDVSAATFSQTSAGPVAAGSETQAARQAIAISAAVADQSPLSRPESEPAAIAPAAAPVTNSRGDQSIEDQPDGTTVQARSQPDTQPASPDLGTVVAAVLLARGNALLETGDVAAARLMYERAASSNSGPAAAALGMTYDPRFLPRIGAQGVASDPQQAAIWYRRASDLGVAGAVELLKQLPIASER